jgi:hypothetical protein
MRVLSGSTGWIRTSKTAKGFYFDFFDTGTSRAELKATFFAGSNLE